MKKKNSTIGVTVLLLFFTNLFFAQYQQKIDSLKQLLKETTSDSSKIKLYREISWNYGGIRTELATSRIYADSMNLLSKKLDNKEGIIGSYLCYGMINRYEGNYETALEYLNKYVSYYQKKQNPGMEVEGLYQIATINQWLGNYDECLSAYKYILETHEKHENWNGMVATLNGIGIIYKRTEQYQKAIATYKKAISINDDHNLGRDLTYIHINMGNAYNDLKLYEKAFTSYEKSLKISRESNNFYGIAANLSNIGTNYKNRNLPNKALDYHLQALEIRKTLPNKRGLLISLISTGELYKTLKKNESAEKYLKMGMDLAKELHAKPQLARAYESLTKLYANTNNYRNAYTYNTLCNSIQDSIFNEEKSQQIAELQTKYETDQKDKEIELLTKENQLKEATSEKEATLRKTLIAGLVLLAIIGSLIFHTMRQRLRNQKMLVEKNEEIKRSQYREQLQTLEMKALRAQMNPHFLFNSLNSINTMIISDDNDNASKYLSKFSKLVRLMLENSEQPRVSLHDEINMLETYIQLEILRFNNKIEYNIEIDESIDQDGTYIPSMVLQPFVENAIWHGLLHKDKKGLLTITIKEDKDNLLCSITDNGIGREKSLTLQKDVSLKKTSMGIKITTDRLKLLTKQTINDVISIIDLKDKNNNALGTKVNIQIPIS